MNLFAYGTLMFLEIWERVIGGEFRCIRATVSGMRVYRAAGELFPVMVAATADDIAVGAVVFDLTPEQFAALDAYESDFYERVAVKARLKSGRELMAQTYLLPAERRHLASDEPWSAEWFRREAMGEYMKQCGW